MKQNETSVDYAQPDPADAYKQAFAAFSGAKWVSAPQYRQSPEVLLAAGAISKTHGVEALITQKDIDKIAAEVKQRCMAAGVPQSEIDKLLATLKSNVGASKSSLEEIRGEALKAADDLVSEASGKASETPEQKVERLWGEIEQLNKKTLEGIDALQDNDLMGQKEADKWKAELNEIMAMQNGQEKAKRLANFNQRYGDRLQQILDSLPLDDPRREIVVGLIAKEREKGEGIEMVRNGVNQAYTPPTPPPSIEVASITPAPEKSTASNTTIGNAEDVSRADSGQLSPPDVTRIASAAQQGPTF